MRDDGARSGVVEKVKKGQNATHVRVQQMAKVYKGGIRFMGRSFRMLEHVDTKNDA